MDTSRGPDSGALYFRYARSEIYLSAAEALGERHNRSSSRRPSYTQELEDNLLQRLVGDA